jgi:hypothetical protein
MLKKYKILFLDGSRIKGVDALPYWQKIEDPIE